MAKSNVQRGEGVSLQDKDEVEVPRRYKVLLHNDHYTTMEFVVQVLEDIFRKRRSEAFRIMLNVHENGLGIAGVYVKEIAETKIVQVHDVAREHGYPLRCSMERD